MTFIYDKLLKAFVNIYRGKHLQLSLSKFKEEVRRFIRGPIKK